MCRSDLPGLSSGSCTSERERLMPSDSEIPELQQSRVSQQPASRLAAGGERKFSGFY